MNNIDIITKILKMKTIAVVGFSPKKERPSHYVSMYMKDNGYDVIPVNPGHREIAGMTCYPDLESIPEQVDVVDFCRRSEFVLPIVDSAISMGAKAIWMQDRVFHEDAAQKAKDEGILVIMDNCMLRQHRLMN